MKPPLDPESEQARSYQHQRQVLTLLHLVMSPLILTGMLLSAYSQKLAAIASSGHLGWIADFSIFFTLFSLTFMIFDLPFAYYSGYSLEKKYGLSNQTRLSWSVDFLKRALLGFAVSLGLLLALYVLIRRFPEAWWLWAWAGFAIFTYGMGKLFPILIVPLFYRYGPVESQSLKDRIARLASRFGLSVERIHSINLSRTTRKANAAFMGMGRTKRVVLSDTLLDQFEEDEIEAVLAHELGHCCHKDIWRMFAVNLGVTFVSFRLAWMILPEAAERLHLEGPADMAGLPLLLLIFSVFSLFIQPLIHGISRHIETQADRFALLAMGSKEAFIRCMRKLAKVNLADPRPHPLYEWFFYDHPAIYRRIAYAEDFKMPPLGKGMDSSVRGGFVSLVLVCALTAASTVSPLNFVLAEETSQEKDLKNRQEMEWRRFYLTGEETAEMPQTTLAIDFFNQAVEAYQGQDYELAREALVESLKLNARNAFAYELMGDMAAEEQDIESARESYKKAYLIQPSQKLKEKIEKTGRQVRLENGLHEFTKGHFLIRTKQIQEGEVEKLEIALEKLFSKLVKDFGYSPREALPVTLYERSEFAELTQLPHWVGGMYDGNLRLPVYHYGILEESFSAVAIHEMTHAFVGRMSRKKAPAWIQEGLAVYMENQVQPRDFMVLRLAVKTQSLLPMDQMMNEQKVTQREDALFASLFYEQAFSLTDYLMKKHGMFKIKKLLKAFADGKDYDEALREAFGGDPEKLEKRWKSSLIKKYS